ncbi:helix-turn-helix domain-containing protein [Gemmiger sp.]|uniref:helix-turn-helix domain-containing protein n=1 Tax=Gemmiger sp. TaxID=2049027 RepID=UPI002A7F087D|nr:helix-turn-helix domain-containing protein [Gemmiger sp.]MDY4448693.1 helix-turn-helix domain-containing protein [Gemmiger sp.]
MTLGQNLQAARKAKGLSQETLAERIGVSRQALGKWEKDTALPGLDNLQAAAQVLGVSVDTLLGTGCADPAPAVTLDAMRDLLAARDAEQRRRRLWGLLGAAGAIVAVLLLVVQNMAYQRKMQSLTDSYANLQQQLSSTTAALTARMDELQDAERQGKSTVMDWHWIPLDKLHKDVQNGWMPVLVQVTPSESTAGMTARLSVTYGDTTGLYNMDELPGSCYQAQLVFEVGQTYELTVQWTAPDGTAANEKLGTVDFTETQTEPELAWGRTGGSLDYGYYLNRSGNKKYLQLSCYPVEVELTVPGWMKIADVTLELRTGEAGEPLATAPLAVDGWYSVGEQTTQSAVWHGTFYNDDGPNEWLYTDGSPFYRAVVTDTTGTVWTFEMPLENKN